MIAGTPRHLVGAPPRLTRELLLDRAHLHGTACWTCRGERQPECRWRVRFLIPIPTASPPGDPQKISNRYTEEVGWEILLLEPVNDWFLGLCKNAPAVADKVEQAIDELAI